MTDAAKGAEGQRIGILGGSFNPAHDGHLHIAQLALERLGLDAVWLMVALQNPLKPVAGMATFDERFASAHSIAAGDPRISARDVEAHLGTRFTAETLPAVVEAHSGVRFVWIMGADNLMQMDQWEDWTSIFNTVPIAVFARPPYDSQVLACTVATRFADCRHDESRGEALADMGPPAWIYFDTPLNPESATQIRSRRNRETASG